MSCVLTLDIELHEPLLATGLEGDPNAGISLPYVAGSLLRGVAIGRYQGTKEASDSAFRRLFLDGTTRFLNGYPIVAGQRSLPCPRSLMKDKYRSANDQTVWDQAVAANMDATLQWQSVSGSLPFVVLNQEPALGCRPSRTIQVHTARNRRMGRASENDGAVFRYESVSSKQLFRAYVICESNDMDTISNLLKGAACLGGSRTAGYGHAAITVAANSTELTKWTETGAVLPSADLTGTLRLTLLSDAILVDAATGQNTTNADLVLSFLASRLNSPDLDDSQCEFFLQSTSVGGFNRKWGLPLVQTPALSMGSVIVIRNGRFSAASIANLIQQGIGFRRAEGFGRLAVNWQVAESFVIEERACDTAAIGPATNQAQAALSFIQSRLRQRRIEEEIQAQALQIKGIPVPKDCRSPVQNLRLEVMNELRLGTHNFNSNSGIGAYINKLNDRRPVRDKYDKIRVRAGNHGVRRILDWLGQYLNSQEAIQITIPNLANHTDSQVKLTGTEAYRFRLQVAFTVLGRLAKDSKQASRRHQGADQ